MQCTSSFADQGGGHLRRPEIKRSNVRNWSEEERISPNTIFNHMSDIINTPCRLQISEFFQ